jgi:hypothetical protein
LPFWVFADSATQERKQKKQVKTTVIEAMRINAVFRR